MYKIFCVILAFFTSCLSFIGIDLRQLQAGESVTAGEVRKEIYVESQESVTLNFEKQSINTVELKMKETGAALIEIYADGNFGEPIYSRDGTEICRFCAFKSVEAQSITVKIIGERVTVKSIEVSYKRGSVDSFRVTSYFVASSIAAEENSIDKKCFDIITDAILFGCVTFDESGSLKVDKTLLNSSLSNLREAIDGRDVKVYINLLGPESQGSFDDWYEQMADKASRHSAAFKSGKLESAVAALVEEYGFDGVFFDYEYPIKLNYWLDFSEFLVSLNEKTDKKIGLALAHWDIGLSRKALKAVDMIEMMQYDLFNAVGHHSDFDSAVDGAKAARDYFIPGESVDLGLPFYGRPADGSAVWYNYSQYAEALGESTDFITADDGKAAYFNSRQSVYDKTAYAMSSGLGGMMVWHYACDVADVSAALSLFGAIGDCMADRA